MICFFNITEEHKVKETKKFFSSIGASAWFKDDDGFIDRRINVEFIHQPESLVFLDNIENIGGICSLNQ